MPRIKKEKFRIVRSFAIQLKLYNHKEWKEFIKIHHQADLLLEFPYAPEKVYKNKGWMGWGNFLGHDKNWKCIPRGKRTFDHFNTHSFKKARSWARKSGIKTAREWKRAAKEKRIPFEIPHAPHHVYKDEWINWGDFLGTKRISNNIRKYRSYEEAKKFVSSLNIGRWKEWWDYCVSGKKPLDIPGHPNKIYKEKGWISMREFLK